MQPEAPIQPTYSTQPVPDQTSGFTKKQKIVILTAGIFVGLMLLLMLLVAILSAGGGKNEQEMMTIEARNSEIIRLIDEYGTEVRTAEIARFIAQTNTFVVSDNLMIQKYNADEYGRIGDDKLANDLGFQSVEATLAGSINDSRFDKELSSAIQGYLQQNEETYRLVFQNNDDVNLESIIETAYANVESLIN